MRRNTIRRSNGIYARRLWKIFAGIFVVTAFSMVFVFLQVCNVQLADDVKKLETQLAEINKRNNALKLEVEYRMTPRVLQQKIREFGLDLVSVADLPKVKAPVFSSSTPYGAAAYAQTEGGEK